MKSLWLYVAMVFSPGQGTDITAQAVYITIHTSLPACAVKRDTAIEKFRVFQQMNPNVGMASYCKELPPKLIQEVWRMVQ